MTRAIYPGSFDPITKGHLSIIKQASKRFNLTVLIVNNPSKQHMFDLEERKRMVKNDLITNDIKANVEICDGITASYAEDNGIETLIRGLRSVTDFMDEFQMSEINKDLYPDMETIFFISNKEISHVSSSMVKQLHYLGKDISKYVSHNTVSKLNHKIKGEVE